MSPEHLGSHRTAREDQVHGAAVPDQPRQPHGAAVDQGDAPAPAEHPEHRVLFGDPQVAPQRQLETAGHRVTTHRGDDRLGQRHPGRAHRAGAGAVRLIHLGCSESLEIGSGTEGSVVAAQHRHRGRVVGVEFAERVEQLGRRRAVDRVARLAAGS